jgi:glycosyltransferase involved in cell wall biosynthesis
MVILSISIPTYNRCEILKHTLTNIFNQIDDEHLHQLIEVVVSDNASTDNTEEVVKEFIALNKFKIVYSRNTKNLGLIKNIINLVPLSTGKFWMFYGDDDMPPQGSLVKLIELFKSDETHAAFMFKQQQVANNSFKSYSVDSSLTISQLASSYFYYIGNAGVFAVKHNLALEAVKSYNDQLITTCWPQTNVLFLAAGLSKLESPILASTITSFYSETENLVYYNSYYLFETLLYSLLRSAISIDSVLQKQFVNHAKKSIYAIEFFETYKKRVVEQYIYYDYEAEKKQFLKTLKEAMVAIPIEHNKEIAFLNNLLNKPLWYIKWWLYKQYFKKTKSLQLKVPFLNKLKILSPLGYKAIISNERKQKYDYYKQRGKGVDENSGYF